MGRSESVHPCTRVILRTAMRHRIDLHRSFMMATDLGDLGAGRDAGLTTIGVGLSPGGSQAVTPGFVQDPLHAVATLEAAFELARDCGVGS